MSDNKVVVIFTKKSVATTLKDGGTRSWHLDRNNARQCEYAILTRNANHKEVEGPEEHHAAFLVGKIQDVVPSPFAKGRFLIRFSEYAPVSVPKVWKGYRNPVKYADSLEAFGIDPDSLEWKKIPEPAVVEEENDDEPDGLTIAQAKKGLALTFGVKPEAIEITIRG